MKGGSDAKQSSLYLCGIIVQYVYPRFQRFSCDLHQEWTMGELGAYICPWSAIKRTLVGVSEPNILPPIASQTRPMHALGLLLIFDVPGPREASGERRGLYRNVRVIWACAEDTR